MNDYEFIDFYKLNLSILANQTTVLTFDNANRLTAVDEQTYTFDDNGNLLSDGEYTYTYDAANRLVGVSKTDTSVSYAYNGNGDRLQQTVS